MRKESGLNVSLVIANFVFKVMRPSKHMYVHTAKPLSL